MYSAEESGKVIAEAGMILRDPSALHLIIQQVSLCLSAFAFHPLPLILCLSAFASKPCLLVCRPCHAFHQVLSSQC